MTTPQDRFVRHVALLQGRIDKLPDVAVQDILELLARLRRHVLGEIAAADGFEGYRLRALEAAIQEAMASFVDQYGHAVVAPQLEMFALGQDLAAAPLVEAGIMFHVPQLSRRQLEAVQQLQDLMIADASDEAVGQIVAALRLGRQETVPEVLQRIRPSLASPGPFGTLDARAEAITRTELGRIQSIATQAGLEASAAHVPGLEKAWMHSGKRGATARPGHIEAAGQTRPVSEPFRVHAREREPYEALMYPRDPAATAANSVNCGCTAVPHLAAWSGAIAQARTETAAFLAARGGQG